MKGPDNGDEREDGFFKLSSSIAAMRFRNFFACYAHFFNKNKLHSHRKTTLHVTQCFLYAGFKITNINSFVKEK